MQTFKTSQKMLRLVSVSLVHYELDDQATLVPSINFMPLHAGGPLAYSDILNKLKSFNDIDPMLRTVIPANELVTISKQSYEPWGPTVSFGTTQCYGDGGLVLPIYRCKNHYYYIDFDMLIMLIMVRVNPVHDVFANALTEELKQEVIKYIQS